MRKKTITIKDCSKNPARSCAPWMVRYYRARIGVSEFVATHEIALQRKRELEKLFGRGIDAKKMEEVNRLVAGTGYDPAEMVKMGIRAVQRDGAAATSPSARFRDGAALVVARAEKDETVSSVTVANYKFAYAMINKVFGDTAAAYVKEADVIAFLDGMNNAQREPGKAAMATKRTFAIYFKMALKAVGIVSPLPNLPKYASRDREVKFFTESEVRTMLSVTPVEERGLVALALFSTMRPELLGKLPAECVDVDERTITIPAHLAKDRNRHVLEAEFVRPDGRVLPGLPDVLWEWLRLYPFKPTTWLNVRLRLQAALGGHWIHDGLRKTGATNYNAFYGAAATGALLTHEGLSLVFKHYVGATTRKAASEFYLLTPSAIAFLQQRAKYGHIDVIPKAEMEKLIWTKPMGALARDLGCSLAGLFKHCVRFDIKRPNQGYWAGIRFRENKRRNATAESAQEVTEISKDGGGEASATALPSAA